MHNLDFFDDKSTLKKGGFTHDNVNNKSVDWFTPKWIFDDLKIQFDLDPCAPTGGVPWIPAKQHYDIYADGLVSEWFGNVWLNPARYGIICLNIKKGKFRWKNNVQNVKRVFQKRLIFSTLESQEIVFHHGAKNAQKKTIKKGQKNDLNPLLEQSFIKMLNLVLKFAVPAVKKSLCQMITLDCALRYEQGLTQNVRSALKKEREKNRLCVEKILLKEKNSLTKKNGILQAIKDEKESVFNLLRRIIFGDKEAWLWNGDGVLSNGKIVKNTGIINALTVENAPSLHKTITFQFHINTALERFQKTLCQPVYHATVQNSTITRINGQKRKSLNKLKGIFKPFLINFCSNVWLNPPYGKHTSKWLEKMHHHRNGIALVFARTDCNWFHDYVANADAILFIKQRVKFVDGLGVTSGNGAGCGSMLIAWGNDNVKALERMQHKGKLWRLS